MKTRYSQFLEDVLKEGILYVTPVGLLMIYERWLDEECPVEPSHDEADSHYEDFQKYLREVAGTWW